jgi:flagellar biogenesis protein FliO
MDLQNTFYVLGIVFMSLSLLILVGIIVLLFYIKKKVASIHAEIEAKIDDINNYAVKPVKKVVDIAGSFFSKRSTRKSSRPR